MLITFLVRSRAWPETSYHSFHVSTVGAAFHLAYMLDNDPKVLEIICLLDGKQVDTLPGSPYTPKKLVRNFNYHVE